MRKPARQRQDIDAAFTAEGPELVLDHCRVDLVDVEEIRGKHVVTGVAVPDAKAHLRRVCERSAGVIHAEHRRVQGCPHPDKAFPKVLGESGNPAHSRNVRAYQGNALKVGWHRSTFFIHITFPTEMDVQRSEPIWGKYRAGLPGRQLFAGGVAGGASLQAAIIGGRLPP